jgi:PBSX family phage terminase large subunit
MEPICFNPKQAWAYLNLKARVSLMCGSIRSGKTFISMFMFLKALKECPSGDVIIVGKTERTLQRNIINPIIDMVGTKNASYKMGTGEFFVYGRRCYVISAADESSETRLRGMTVVLVLGDEVTTWPENFYTQMLGRMSKAGARAILTTNPDSPFHWLKKNYIDKAKGSTLTPVEDQLDMEVMYFYLSDNKILPKEYINSITKEFTGVFYKRFILGQWVMAEGRIYDMFEEEVNVYPNNAVPEWPDIIEYWISCDYGTGSVTVFTLFGRDSFGKCYVIDEYYYKAKDFSRQKTDDEFVFEMEQFIDRHNQRVQAAFGDDPESETLLRSHLIRHPKNILIYADPNATSFIRSLYKAGFALVKKANNDVLDGIRFVGNAFTARKLFIHQRCKNGLQEVPNYVWDEKKQLLGEDKPIKQNDHFCLTGDMLVITSSGKKPIKELVGTKGKVLSYNETLNASGWYDYTVCMKTGTEVVYSVELEDGRIIKATGDHPILTTNRGWVAVKDLLEGDDVRDIQ